MDHKQDDPSQYLMVEVDYNSSISNPGIYDDDGASLSYFLLLLPLLWVSLVLVSSLLTHWSSFGAWVFPFLSPLPIAWYFATHLWVWEAFGFTQNFSWILSRFRGLESTARLKLAVCRQLCCDWFWYGIEVEVWRQLEVFEQPFSPSFSREE